MKLKNCKGFLFDIEGTLFQGNEVIKGAPELIAEVRKKFPVRFISNTTSRPPKFLYEQLSAMGFKIELNEIFTALGSIRNYIISRKAGAYFLLSNKALAELRDIPSEPVDFVVVGHAHENFSYENINRAFRYLMSGAKLLSAGISRYYKDKDDKLSLDGGAFTIALEYSSGQKALVLGKPNQEFFKAAVSDMKLSPSEVAVIGDDILTDVDGAQKTGLTGILVKTGKFRESDLGAVINPDFVLDRLPDLKNLL